MKNIIILAAILISGISAKAQSLELDSKLVSKKDSCDVKNPKKTVYIFKQWHLDPTENTKFSKKQYEQSENQIAIYDQIKKWMDNNTVHTVLAEGCSGEIKKDFSKKFNGWTMQDLITKPKDQAYGKILTHIPMKLKAYYADKIQAICVDDEKEIKEQLLDMSDIRGDTGFLTRIQELKDDPDHQKVYVNSAREILKLPKTKSTDDVISYLKKDIEEKLQRVQDGISKRNKAMVENIKKTLDEKEVFVVGGLHAKELKSLLEDEKIGCEILEPKGYKEF
mgnify:CR=1 FL=1